MRYFVTGATGFLGSEIVRQLVDRGDGVVALVRSPEKTDRLPDDVEIAIGDITEKATMREPMAGADGVFHIAGWYNIGVDDPESAKRINVDGTRLVLELMDELDIPRGVYTSTLAVFSDTNGARPDESYRYDGPHLTRYDLTKWRAHYEVAEPMVEDGLPLIILQPGAIYGPGDRGPTWDLWQAFLRRRLPAIPSSVGYCFGHVEDTARAHLRAMDDGTPGESYIVAGEPLSLVEVFEIVEAITGRRAPIAVPPAMFRILARLISPVDGLLPRQYSAEAMRVLGGVTYYGDNSKATRELDLEHRPIRAGLQETLESEMVQLGIEPGRR